jgi:hypothetical protein
MKTIRSKQGALQGRDLKKGGKLAVIIAILYPAIEFLQKWIISGNSILDIDVNTLVNAVITGLIAYLFANFIEPSKVGVIQAEGKKARKIIAGKQEGNPPPVGDPTHPKG